MKIALSLILFAIPTFNLNGQIDSCLTYLKNANSEYEQHSYDKAIALLTKSLDKCNLYKTDKIQAHKLLALCYLSIDKLEEADKEASTIVKLNPNYAPDRFRDEPKYSALFAKFSATPIFRIGFQTGINNSIVKVKNRYSIYHGNNSAEFSSYKNQKSFQLGILLEYQLFHNLWINLNGMYRVSAYEHLISEVENDLINYSEKLNYIDVPLSLKYYFLKKRFQPYLKAGGTFSYLNNALSASQRTNSTDLVDRTAFRNRNTIGWNVGAGVSYKIKNFVVFGDFQYTQFSKNVNKEGTRYLDLVNVFKYYYIDDDFALNNLQFNVGFLFNLVYNNKNF